MALSLATGSAQTSNCATQTPLYPATGSYVFSKDDPGEAVYTNVAAALDQPNSIRFAVAPISNVFNNVALNPISGQGVAGLSMLCQVNEVWKVDDAADSLAPLLYPASAHMVIKVPTDALVTPAVVSGLIMRLFGAPFRNGTDSMATAITSFLHGVARF